MSEPKVRNPLDHTDLSRYIARRGQLLAKLETGDTGGRSVEQVEQLVKDCEAAIVAKGGDVPGKAKAKSGK